MLSTSTSRDSLLWARALGAAWAIASLALLWPLTSGISLIAGSVPLRGMLLVALALAGRFAVAAVARATTRSASLDERARLRDTLPTLLADPARHNERAHVNTLWAIDRLSEASEFEALRGAAAASMVAVVVIFIGGGWMSTAIVLGLLALSIPFYIAAGKSAAAYEEEYRLQRAQLVDRQLDVLLHSLELRGLGATDFGARDVVALSDREHRTAMTAIRRALRSSLVTEFLGGVSVGLVAMVVGFGLLHGTQGLRGALLAVFASAELVGWVRRYGTAFHRREAVATAAELLHSTSTSVVPSTDPALLSCSDLVTRASATPLTFTIGPSDHLLLTGPSGSGKSTLIETILGWLPPVAGLVRRGQCAIGHVGVSSALVAGTVRDNLALGHDLGDDFLRELLRDAALDFDLDRTLSPDGAGLSSGERVRLLVVRALANGATLLVLDDVAGMLDGASISALRALIEASGVAILEATPHEAVLIHPTSVVRL